MPERKKLSASALTTFLKSPKSFYWRYIAKLEPLGLSVASYDHDKLCGSLWSEFLDRFYKGVGEDANTAETLTTWDDKTDGWVPEKAKDRLTKAIEHWAAAYYQMFNAEDGARYVSELRLENDRFMGYLDGLSRDNIIHEVKSTSRSPQLDGQLWKVQNSIQCKLYAVLAKAEGIRIEFAFKDPPYALYRSQVIDVTQAQRDEWEAQLNSLADYIFSLGDDPNNYVCSGDCCLVTKGVTSMCGYYTLCADGLNENTKIAYQERVNRR